MHYFNFRFKYKETMEKRAVATKMDPNVVWAHRYIYFFHLFLLLTNVLPQF